MLNPSFNSLILATSNTGKLIEMQACLHDSGITLKAQTEFNVPDAEETGLTFIENALIKARNACHHTGFPAIADDSGLMVPALDYRPGLYSARFSGPHSTAALNCEKLLQELAAKPNACRRAYFYALIVFLRHKTDPCPLISEGYWHGEILHQPQGPADFGFNPLFFVPTHQCSAAELSVLERNKINHRGIALRQLQQQLKPLFNT